MRVKQNVATKNNDKFILHIIADRKEKRTPSGYLDSAGDTSGDTSGVLKHSTKQHQQDINLG
jgi:hypothetical protein